MIACHLESSFNVMDSELCRFCGRVESVEHVLLFWPYAWEVWEEVKHTFNISLDRLALSWLFHFLSGACKLSAMVLAIAVWQIWEVQTTTSLSSASHFPEDYLC